MARARRRLTRWVAAMHTWPMWALPRWLTGLVVLVITADVAAIGVSAAAVRFSVHDLVLFGLLLGCITVTVELTRNAGEKGGLIKDVYGAWDLPAAILLPPLYILIITIVQYALIQWRIRRAPVYRRAYTAAAAGLSFALAGVVFRSLSHLTIAGNTALTAVR